VRRAAHRPPFSFLGEAIKVPGQNRETDMRLPLLAALALVLLAGPATAASRGYTITSFDKIRVTGPFTVNLRTESAASARAEGSTRALDQVRVEVQGRTLMVTSGRNNWGGWTSEDVGPVVIDVTTPSLAAAILTGSGKLNIDRAKAARFDLSLTGSGNISIGALVQGSGGIAGAKLVVTDLDLSSSGSGDISLAATRAAKVNATGSGDVVITGPAACLVHATGSGDVRCGPGR
jgi:hypothetical protein